MVVVKKTVAINPIIDSYIREMWAMLIKQGLDASYSTALNYMLLEHISDVADRGVGKDARENLESFLKDQESIRDLNLEDYSNMADGLFREKDKKRK